MKAIRVNSLGGPEVMQLESVPLPQPSTNQILVKIEAIGVNPVDTYIRSGYQGYNPEVPYTPGFDAAGIVKKCGEDIVEVKDGDRVYLSGAISGTYAEYALCQQSQVHPLPDHVSFVKGAGIFVAYVTAYRALIQRAHARPGETVLIHGASGGVGLAAIQFAGQMGLKIIATASTKEGRQLASENGAHFVTNHTSTEHFTEIMNFTQQGGVDIIIEMMAHLNLADNLKILAPQGRVIVIGSRDDIAITPRDLMACDGLIQGVSLMNISEPDQHEIHAAIVAGLTNKTLNPPIRCELPLAEAAQAHTMVMKPGACGKIVLTL